MRRALQIGTLVQVWNQARKRCRIFWKEGGIIFNSVRNILHHPPLVNIVAVTQAIQEFNGGKANA